jgi:toxin ParE1/3/4
MKLLWLPRARDDVRHAVRYVARNNPRAAAQIGARIMASAQRLQMFPELGRPGRVAGTRELVVPRTPYIIAYQITGGDIEILAVIHTARRWPDSFD